MNIKLILVYYPIIVKIFKKSVCLCICCDFKSYFKFYKLNFNILNKVLYFNLKKSSQNGSNPIIYTKLKGVCL